MTVYPQVLINGRVVTLDERWAPMTYPGMPRPIWEHAPCYCITSNGAPICCMDTDGPAQHKLEGQVTRSDDTSPSGITDSVTNAPKQQV